jgi:hypothetical protein
MKLNQYGQARVIVVLLVVSIILLVGSIVFGTWSYSNMNKYKNNADQLISTAVANAKSQQQVSDNKAFAIQEQKPLIRYVGPQAYGTISLYYPRNWNAYIDSTGQNGAPISGYFYPGILPTVTDNGKINFALRLRVENQPYSSIAQTFQSYIRSNLVSITPYSLPKLPSVVGIKVVGNIEGNVSGTMIILPMRTNTLEVWTEGSLYLSEFNTDILPNLSFSP